MMPAPHVALNAGLVHDLVDLVGRDAGPHGSRGNVEHLAGQAADLAHALLCLGVELLDLVGADEGPAGLGDAIFGVVGVGDRCRDRAGVGEGVDGSERARVVEGGPGVEEAGVWIWFRNKLWREEAIQYTVFWLVHQLVRALQRLRSAPAADVGGDSSVVSGLPNS